MRCAYCSRPGTPTDQTCRGCGAPLPAAAPVDPHATMLRAEMIRQRAALDRVMLAAAPEPIRVTPFVTRPPIPRPKRPCGPFGLFRCEPKRDPRLCEISINPHITCVQ